MNLDDHSFPFNYLTCKIQYLTHPYQQVLQSPILLQPSCQQKPCQKHQSGSDLGTSDAFGMPIPDSDSASPV